MSFEIKLDRNREPIVDPALKQQMHAPTPDEQPEPVQEAVAQESAVEVSEPQEQVVEQQTATEPVSVPVAQQAQESVAQESFRQLRAKADQAERERDELIRLLRERELKAQASVPKAEPEEDNEVNVGSDDLVEGKHLTKVGRQIKQLKQEIEIQKRQAVEMATETKLRALYPDFEKIVSPDNINALRIQYPEIANTINSSSGDLYSKAVSAYTMIKKLVHQESSPKPVDTYVADKLKAQTNAAKPRPLASMSPTTSNSPLTQANAFANGLTKDLQEQLRKEMEDARRAM